jgi:hypothetical protein
MSSFGQAAAKPSEVDRWRQTIRHCQSRWSPS